MIGADCSPKSVGVDCAVKSVRSSGLACADEPFRSIVLVCVAGARVSAPRTEPMDSGDQASAHRLCPVAEATRRNSADGLEPPATV